jgi:acetyl esterase/lipase
MKTILAAALLLFASPALAADQIAAQSTVKAAAPVVHRDLPYTEPKADKQTLDVYSPANGRNHPVVFWIHGGGWMVGDKADVQNKPPAFVAKEFVFVSTNYRLFPSVSIKTMAGDVAKAIRWTHDHAADYGGDPNTIFVMGHSAGAQLSALLCTNESFLKAEGLSLSNIKGCVPVDGDTYDLATRIALAEKKVGDRYIWKFGDEQSRNELSPIMHVAKGKNIPPFLLLYVLGHKETDPQAHRLEKALQDADISAKSFGAENSEHDKLNNGIGLRDDKATKAMFEFLDGVLKK